MCPKETSPPANGSTPTQVSARQKDKATEEKDTNRSRPSNVLSSPWEASTFAPKEETSPPENLEATPNGVCARQRNESAGKARGQGGGR